MSGFIHTALRSAEKSASGTDISRDDVKLVPLIVGHPSSNNAREISAALEPFWHDPSTFFIISTDFCHWCVPSLPSDTRPRTNGTDNRGSRFRHTPYYPDAPEPSNPVPPVQLSSEASAAATSGEPPSLLRNYVKKSSGVPIWKSIQYMDHQGIDLLRHPASDGAVDRWLAYLDATRVSGHSTGSGVRREGTGIDARTPSVAVSLLLSSSTSSNTPETETAHLPRRCSCDTNKAQNA